MNLKSYLKNCFSIGLSLFCLLAFHNPVDNTVNNSRNTTIVDQPNATYIYSNTTASSLSTQSNCSTVLSKTFEVTDAFVVNDLNVGIILTHTWRGDVQVQLTSPTGNTQTIISFSGDNFDNYDLLLDDESGGSLNSGTNQSVNAPNYEGDRTVLTSSLSNFEDELAEGTWTLTFCNVLQSSHTSRTLGFVSAKLEFDGDAIGPGGLISNIPCTAGANEIRGTVFEDFNYNGIYNSSEFLGVAGVVVTAYDSLDNSFNTVTSTTGTYVLDGLIASRTYRVEFTFPDSVNWAESTFFQGDNGTTVQFVQPGNCANLGVANPTDYCETLNPSIIISCFETGNAVYGATGNENKSIVSLPYNSSGPTVTGISEVAQIYETGSVWGLAWQPTTQRVFGATNLKRHTGLGSLGLGGVYVMSYQNGVRGNLINSFDLAGVTPANGGATIDLGSVLRSGSSDYTLPNSNNSDSYDIDAFSKIGKVGFGDADMEEDGQTLWLVNLHQRALISVDVSDPNIYPGTVNQYLIDDFTNVPSCTNGVLRPWGLGFSKGTGYIGCVCTGENGGTISNTQAYVLSFDPNNPTIFTNEVNFDLDYSRELAVRFTTANSDGEWHPWVDTWAQTGFTNTQSGEVAYAQPTVSDIDFAENGDMIIAMADRFGFQMGYNNYRPVSGATTLITGDAAGDLIKACYSNGSWVLEGSAGCTDNDTNSTELDDGPSGMGEFFFRDDFDDTNFSPVYNHNETSLGSIDILKGTGEITATHYDPINGNYAFDLGLLWHDNFTGARTDEFRIIGSGPVEGKGNNLGDMITACAPAPLQIGNLVWLDTDRDGIQDGGEIGLEGIRVELYSNTGTLLGFDTTTANGTYYFSGRNTDNATWLTTDDTLTIQTNYYIILGNGQFTTNTSILVLDGMNYELTTDSTDTGGGRYERDSDGILFETSPGNAFDGLPGVLIQTGSIGQVNHSFDFGFKTIEYDYGDLPDAGIGTSGITNYETLDANNGPSHRIIEGLQLGLLNDADADGVSSLTAEGDDNLDGIDDEDGLTILSSLTLIPGGTIRIPFSAINTTGDTAYVRAWIDWNGDGELIDELVIDYQDNEDGIFPAFLEINIPENSTLNQHLGFRIRLSNTTNMTPYGQLNAGEVEDYIVNLNCPESICLPIDTRLEREE